MCLRRAVFPGGAAGISDGGLRPARMELPAPWPAVRYRPGKGQESVGRGARKEKRALFPHVADRLRSGIDARQGQQKKHQRVLAERAGEIPLEQGGDHPLRAAARTVIACGRKDQAGRAQGVEQQAQEKQGEQHGGGPQRAANGFPLHGHPPFRQSVPVLI